MRKTKTVSKPKSETRAEVNVSLAVDDEYLAQFSAVVKQATAAGLHVDSTLEGIGVFTGTIDETKVADLRKVAGIAHVEGAREYQLAPPNSPVQ